MRDLIMTVCGIVLTVIFLDITETVRRRYRSRKALGRLISANLK